MMRKPTATALLLFVGASLHVLAWRQTPQSAATPPPPSKQTEVIITLSGEAGAPPKYAVPDLIVVSNEPETVAAAKEIAQVLWDDFQFEREFSMIPRDTYASIPAARSLTDVSFDRWRELGADGLIAGTIQKVGNGVRIEIRLFDVRSQRNAFAREYTGSNLRLLAHTVADEVHKEQRALNGVARTKLAFASDRDGERMSNTVEQRGGKEIYISDYDGANQRRVTTNRNLNIMPAWSPDARAIAYQSYRRGSADIYVALIYQGTMEEPTFIKGKTWENHLPAWSPDGTKIAFMSNRDGNPEIYVIDRNGSNLRRITNHPGIDVSPTWSPNGAQIAFTSNRTGSPQIYIVSSDGLNPRKLTSESHCDRPSWSSFNEITYASQTGPGFDIKILDVATGDRKQLTFGEGTNESPVFAPNGRHVAFVSTRSGKSQIFTIARDGKDLRQITRLGNNQNPSWSR